MSIVFPKFSGVYGIQSLTSGRLYVGSSNDLKKRQRDHIYDLNKGRHCNAFMQNHVNKYGFDDLRFFVFELVNNDSCLITREQFYIDVLNPEFNICPKAGSAKGRIVTESHRKALSEANKGRPLTIEHREKLSEAHKGIKPSKETIEKRSLSMMGHVVTQETRDKISQARKGHGVTEETKQKLRDANLGKKLSVEQKKKLSEIHKKRCAIEKIKRIKEYEKSGGVICVECGIRIPYGKVVKNKLCSKCYHRDYLKKWRKRKNELSKQDS